MQKMKKFLAVLTAGVLCAGALPVMQEIGRAHV